MKVMNAVDPVSPTSKARPVGARGADCSRAFRRARAGMQVLQLVLSIVLAIVWFQSATAHAGNPYGFLSSIYKYKLVGVALGRYVAIIVPNIQFVLAICLLFRVLVGGALLVSAIMLTVFSGVQTWAYWNGIKIDCGCFGPANSAPIGQGSIVTVACLATLAYIGFACFCYGNRQPRAGTGDCDAKSAASGEAATHG